MNVAKIIFVVCSILHHYAESSSSSNRNNIPEPPHGLLPARFFYADGTIHERNRPNARPFIEDGYLLGMEDDSNIHPLFSDDMYKVYSFRDRRLVDLTVDERFRLIQGRPRIGRRPPQRRQPSPVEASTSLSFLEPAAFTGLPAQYYYANGAVHEYGRRFARAIIVQNYFLGMVDRTEFLYPVDPSNPYRVYSLITRNMVRITPEIRSHLLDEAL